MIKSQEAGVAKVLGRVTASKAKGRQAGAALFCLLLGACSPAKHFIAGFELHHVFADRFNGPGVINAEPFDLWFQHSRV